MEKNSIEIYKYLYYRNGNNDNIFDYDVHLKLYKYYLFLFYDVETNSPFYMNYEFLYYVIYGFSYFHIMFLSENENYDEQFLKISLEQYNKTLLCKDDDDISIENVIFSLSWLCISNMLEQGNFQNNIEMTKCLLDNNCKINKVLSKVNDRGM